MTATRRGTKSQQQKEQQYHNSKRNKIIASARTGAKSQ
jgi:hypothetical protein